MLEFLSWVVVASAYRVVAVNERGIRARRTQGECKVLTGHELAGRWPTCRVCGRIVLIEGTVNRMEAALDGAGRSLAIEWLETWAARPKGSRLRKLADLQAALEDFANAPERLRLTELNYLRSGLWELKIGRVRLPFVAADCSGTPSSAGSYRRLVLPAHVPAVPAGSCCGRATHGFEKRSERTPRRELESAQAIGREDELR